MTQSSARKLVKRDSNGEPIKEGQAYWWDTWHCVVTPTRVKGKLCIALARPGTAPVPVTSALAGTLSPYCIKSGSILR